MDYNEQNKCNHKYMCLSDKAERFMIKMKFNLAVNRTFMIGNDLFLKDIPEKLRNSEFPHTTV